MTEDEVNLKCKAWIENNGFKYKGVLNLGCSKIKSRDTGFGQVSIPDGTRSVLIDHQGHNDRTKDLIWIEAKGSGVGMSQLLEGFIRVVYACYHGGGYGLLAVPEEEYHRVVKQEDFLRRVSISCERKIGVLNADSGEVFWLASLG